MQNDNELQLIQKGEDAETLLASDAFNNTVNTLVDSTFQSWVNSSPSDKDKREVYYNHYRALVEIVSTLRERVAVKDEIKAKADDDNNREEA